ncbi:MAG: acyl--CoA ligase [Bacteriovoracaceae bacterium]|nr:acyl--CoA ligase [Bacteriovoracaceae bacterium]
MKSKFIFISEDSSKDSVVLEYKKTTEIDTNKKIIGLAVKNKKEFVSLYFDLLERGFVPLVLNASIPITTLKQIAKDHGATRLVLDSGTIEMDSGQTKKKSGHILCSSGTSSASPKSYFFDISKPIENSQAHNNSLGIEEGMRVLFALPLSHSFGVVVGLWSSLNANLEVVVPLEAIGGQKILNLCREEEIDVLYLTPSLARQIIKFKKFYKGPIHSPKIVSIGSSMLFQDELLKLTQIFDKATFFYTYGLTEMGPRAFTNKIDVKALSDEGLPLSLGKPLEGIDYRVSETLKLKSPYACESLEEEFYDTQDLVEQEGGGLIIKGRNDDVIIHQGINVYPYEIETLVKSIEGVDECVLVGMPSKIYGQIPYMVVKAPESIRELIEKLLNDSLAQSHIPKEIRFDIEIPKTSLGKVKRKQLLQLLQDA